MAQNLPIDTSNPLVKDYITLVRLQVLTPLSLAANIVTVLICSIVVNPSIREFFRPSTFGLFNRPDRRSRETISFIYFATPMACCHICPSAIRGTIRILRSPCPRAEAGNEGNDY
jgi:hypothetical protein